MNQNTKQHLRSLELEVFGEIGGNDEAPWGTEGKILHALAKHLDDCGIACPLPSDNAKLKAVKGGVPVSITKKGTPK